MKSLHDNNNGPGHLAVRSLRECFIEPAVYVVPDRSGQGILCLHWVIDDDDIGTETGCRTIDRTRHATSACDCPEMRNGLAREYRVWKSSHVPTTAHDLQAICCMVFCQGLSVTDTQEGEGRVLAQHPGDPGNRDHARLEVARRHSDHEPSIVACSNAVELVNNRIDMPVVLIGCEAT